MALDLVIEGLVAGLLAVTIGYAFVLNRRLTALRAEQDDLGRLISGLNQAAARAQEGIYELRTVAQSAEENLKREIAKARGLSDELAFITEAGNNLAQKIERGLSEGRKAAAATVALHPAASKVKTPQLWDLEENKHDSLRTALRAAR